MTSSDVWDGFGRFRHAWPAELDLMAELAGLELEGRSADWQGAPFTSDSESHVSVWREPSRTDARATEG